MIRAVLAAIALAACAPQGLAAPQPAWVDDTAPFTGRASQTPIADHYRNVAAKIIAAARADRGAYERLEELTDTIGHRLAGSPELDRAIEWAAAAMKRDGLAVHTEKVMVPRWVRGAEDGAILGPVPRALHLLGLGGTVATPKEGVSAPVVVVHDFAELDAKADQIKGAIVLYDVPMTAEHGYGETIKYRTQGASRAAKYGAVASLVRSLTTRSLGVPHTGNMSYAPDQPKIPAAAVSVEDATLIDRLAAKGPVRLYLHLQSMMMPDAESANVIGELRGTTSPDEVVVISGHLDSWDIGQGANDDGAGVTMAMEAARLLARLQLVPRRTIRVVLWTNEENGTRGGPAYAADHAAELPRTVLAVEADSGGAAPIGFTTKEHDPAAAARLHARIGDLEALVRGLGATKLESGGGGADIGAMEPAGVPLVGLETDMTHYFDYHHSDADTFDKIDPAALADDVAVMAVLAYVAADLPARLDAPQP